MFEESLPFINDIATHPWHFQLITDCIQVIPFDLVLQRSRPERRRINQGITRSGKTGEARCHCYGPIHHPHPPTPPSQRSSHFYSADIWRSRCARAQAFFVSVFLCTLGINQRKIHPN